MNIPNNTQNTQHNINMENAMTEQTQQYINTSVFDNKDDYVAFKQFWKQLHKDGKHKKKPVEIHSYPATNQYKKTIVGYHLISDLNFAKHLIYLTAVGKNLDKACGNMSKETAQSFYFKNDDFNYFKDVLSQNHQPIIEKKIWDFINQHT